MNQWFWTQRKIRIFSLAQGNWMRRANEKYNLLRVTFYFLRLTLQTWNPYLNYVDSDNPVSLAIEYNQKLIAVKKRVEGQVWEVSLRTTNLDKERFPSLWAKLCFCIDRRIRVNRKEEWMVSPCAHRLKVNKTLWSVHFGVVVVELAPVVQTLDSAIYRINHYAVDKYLGN